MIYGRSFNEKTTVQDYRAAAGAPFCVGSELRKEREFQANLSCTPATATTTKQSHKEYKENTYSYHIIFKNHLYNER